MSRNNQKAKRRRNRQAKRYEEHLLNTCPDGKQLICRNMFARNVGANTPDGEIARKNIYGNADLTAFYALWNIENPERPRYGF